jgi:hypothetical protein
MPMSTARRHLVLLAVDQEFGEGAALRVPVGPTRVGPLEVRQHEEVEQLSARSRAEVLQTLPESAFELVGDLRLGRLRRPRGVHGLDRRPPVCTSLNVTEFSGRPGGVR